MFTIPMHQSNAFGAGVCALGANAAKLIGDNHIATKHVSMR